MKNIKKSILMLSTLSLLSLSSCYKEPDSDTSTKECEECKEITCPEVQCPTTKKVEKEIKVEKELKLNFDTQIKLLIGTNKHITVENAKPEEKITFSSSDPSVAIVTSNGLVVPITENRRCIITVKSSSGFEKKLDCYTYSEANYFTFNGATFTGCIDNDVEELTLPTKNGNTTLTTIGNSSLYNFPRLKKLVIPQGYTTANEYAIALVNCESISFPASLRVYYSQFLPNLKDVEIANGNTIFVKYNNSVLACNNKNQTYGRNKVFHVFGDFNGIVPQELVQDGIVTSASFGFACQRESVENIVIPEGFTSFNQGAFMGSKYKSITLPYSISSVSTRSFLNCPYLEEIKFGEYPLAEGQNEEEVDKTISNNGKFMIKDNQLLSITKDSSGVITQATLFGTTNKGIIPEGTTHIDSIAFAGKGLKGKIKIPSSVTNIAYGAFIGNPNLKAIYLPSTISSLSNGSMSFGAATNDNFIHLFFGWNLVDSEKCGHVARITDTLKNNIYGRVVWNQFSLCSFDFTLYFDLEKDISSVSKAIRSKGIGDTNYREVYLYDVMNISEEDFDALELN